MSPSEDQPSDFGVQLNWPEDAALSPAASKPSPARESGPASQRRPKAKVRALRASESGSRPVQRGGAADPVSLDVLAERLDALTTAVKALHDSARQRSDRHAEQLSRLGKALAVEIASLRRAFDHVGKAEKALLPLLSRHARQQEQLRAHVEELTGEIQVLRRRQPLSAKSPERIVEAEPPRRRSRARGSSDS